MHKIQKNKEEFFIQLLKDNHIDAVIDVRLRSEPRLAKFAKGENIKNLVEQNNIKYIHEVKDNLVVFAPTANMLTRHRSYKKGENNYHWGKYTEDYLKLLKERKALVVWDEIAVNFSRPCLLCAEPKAEECHRCLLAEYLKKHKRASEIIHLPEK